MTLLAKDEDLSLCPVHFKLLFDGLLEVQHHLASGINDFDVVLFRDAVSFGRLAVGTDQYPSAMQLPELVVGDDLQPHLHQPLQLLAVMHNVAQTVESPLFLKPLFRRLDGVDDP